MLPNSGVWSRQSLKQTAQQNPAFWLVPARIYSCYPKLVLLKFNEGMSMRQISMVLALCGLMFSSSLALAKAKTNKEQPSKAIVNEFINIFYAHTVAFQPKNVGFARYAASMSVDAKNPNWQSLQKPLKV